jgi:hypothetical protein
MAIVFVLHKLRMSKRFNARSGEKLFTSSCSSSKELKDDGELGQQEKFPMRPIEVYQRQTSTSLAQPGEAKNRRPIDLAKSPEHLMLRGQWGGKPGCDQDKSGGDVHTRMSAETSRRTQGQAEHFLVV